MNARKSWEKAKYHQSLTEKSKQIAVEKSDVNFCLDFKTLQYLLTLHWVLSPHYVACSGSTVQSNHVRCG